ncbi:MAG TPA: zinc-dependent alcohol dehydrogenase family protein [Egibacteraceae bacterium]|nr:zinc-dependent alcohol dehydrogenase family protein [Egibacteraceae bacterium]
MRAVVLHEPGSAEVTEVPDPTPAPGEVVVAVDACGICGTDLHIYDGHFAPTPYPIVPGHEFCGEVVAVSADAGDIVEGTFVAVDPSLFCGRCDQCRRGRGNLCANWGAIGDTVDGAFAEYVRVPVANVYRLPADLPREWGTIVEPLSCAVHAMDRLGPVAGDDVLVYGAGTMGLLLAQLLRSAGAARVDVVDRKPDRLAVARPGADEVADSAAALSAERWDLVVDATGATAAIEDGLGRVQRGGTFLVFGVAPAAATARFSPFTVYNDEISIIGSMAVLHSFGRAVDLLAGGAVDPAPLITHRLALDDYETGIATVRAGEGLKVQLTARA